MHRKIVLSVLIIVSVICCAILGACNSKSYKIVYYVNDETYYSEEITDGTIHNVPQDPESEGYIFVGWYLDKGKWNNRFDVDSLQNLRLSSNKTVRVYAKFVDYNCELDDKTHSFTVIEDIPATCTARGRKTEKCENCGYEKKSERAPLQHILTSEIIKSAKCGETGLKEIKCSRENCDYFQTQTIPALKHAYKSEITTPAKCETEGVRTFSCTRDNCNHSYTEPIEALKHIYSNEITTPAKCEIEGVRTFSCTRENCNHSYTEPIEPLQHVFSSETIYEPCVRKGLITHSCTRENCGYTYYEDIPALGFHDCDRYGNCIRCSAENVCSKFFLLDERDNLVYNGNEIDVTIPSMYNGKRITSLYNTFSNNNTIKSVYIPDSIERIDLLTFYSCNNLKTIRMPANVKYIGSSAFLGANITSIYLPKTLEEISAGAFSVGSYLAEVYYEGSQSDWEKIIIGGNNNALFSANITYNYVRNE